MTAKTISIVDIARPLTSLPFILATRFTGKRFWEQLQTHLHDNRAEGFVLLSFAGVEIMDASFADEVFGTLASKRGRKDNTLSPIVLADVNETCLENLRMALETRPDREPTEQERLRNCVLPLLQEGEWTLVGKFEDHVLQTFHALQRCDTLTARDLAEQLGLNLNAASTRLKTLADLGLAQRIEIRDAQGKQYVYRMLQ